VQEGDLAMMRWLQRGLWLLGALLVAAAASAWIVFRASLPPLDGSLVAAGAPAALTLERDAAGLVTVRGATLPQVAYGIGFAHGQDRFFQMDLSRRLAAGELAALLGAAALGQDQLARPFGFRAVARRALAAATPAQRAWLAAYVEGVNAGLGSLRSRPFEYWLLRARPEPWREEDSLLVLHAMWWQLQFADIPRERLRREVGARVATIVAAGSAGEADSGPARAVLQFLFPRGTEWDAPNFASAAEEAEATGGSGAFESPPVPPPELLDLRPRAPRGGDAAVAPPRAAPGSNNWAVAGAHTASGVALVANDMHLMLRVPTVWYRARLRAGDLDLNGVTMPGLPALIAGSNGRIAWGLTNSYGDWSDVSQVSCDLAAGRYMTDSGWRSFERRAETLAVARAAPRRLEVRVSPLGVLLGASPDGRSCTLVRWLALEDGATNLGMLEFQSATDVAQALALAPQVGVPQLNLVVGDRGGRIGWTVIGRIPRGFDGPSTPAPFEWRDASEQPRIVAPEIGRLWTANARPVEGDAERVLGADEAGSGAGYELGARARQIRDDLLALGDRATPADMLRIQLDDRALFLDRWRRLLLATLDEEALKNAPRRAELRRWAEGWDGRAATGSVGYRIVREFRLRIQQATWRMLLSALGAESASDGPPPQFEGPLWRMVTEQPEHLLAASQPAWRDFLLAQADATATALRADCGTLERCTWGAHNRVTLRHPLSGALPWLARLLDLPTVMQPGDQDMPRVQMGSFGASERFAVEPGREAEGYLQLPGGQSGHPLSPFYRAGFDDWAAGRATPLLPGPPAHALRLQPAPRPARPPSPSPSP
jgi:penicillin amidase